MPRSGIVKKKQGCEKMHELPMVPKAEIEGRIKRFQSNLCNSDINGALITQNIDLYYLTGTMQNGVLFVPQSGLPCFYVKKSITRAKFESSVPIEDMGKPKELGTKITSKYGVMKKIGLEIDVIPYGLATRYLQLFQGAQAVDISFELRKQRSIKSPYELNQLKKAALRVGEIIESLPKIIHSGMTELELAAQIEYHLRLKGHINLYRMRGYNQELALGMVASGYAAATPTYFDGPAGGLGVSIASPQGSSFKKLGENEPILVDISTVVEGYIIDQTRMAVIGELDNTMQRAYEVTLGILKEMEKLGRPGVSWQSLYLRSLEMANEAGLKDHFMGYGEDQAKFLGHGVGLELDEFPILARGFEQLLEEGMVIAIEPKFTFPGLGVIGIENTYVVQADGLKALTCVSEEVVKI